MGLDFVVKVARKRVEAEGIVLLDLEGEGAALPAFTAGAHIDVKTPSGAVRQYSLCGSPGQPGPYQIAVLREAAGRGGSASMHDALAEGDRLAVSAPRNHFALSEAPGASLLFAAGIGITPLVAMADALHAQGREFRLHYCARSEARTAFLRRLRERPYAARVRFHFDGGEAGRQLDIAAALATAPDGAHAYVCGPQAFIAAVRDGAARAGWPAARVHFEHFSGATADTRGDGAFDVVLARSGRTVRIAPDVSITQALAAEGVAIDTSCEQGVCGTCLTRVLEGEVDHRDLYLTPEEQASHTQMLPCCSRAASARLVLDL